MILGIDIGGTCTKFGIVDEDYRIKSFCIPTETQKGDIYMVKQMIEKVKEIRREIAFERIGIGTPGSIKPEDGTVVRAANLPYRNTPIAEMFESEFGVPVKLANDATCAVAGELYAGVGQQYDNFIMVTLGTGVGGGIVIGNKIYKGSSGRAGEIGHMIIRKDGFECRCGQRGCYEQYASVGALVRQTAEAIKKYPHSLLAQKGAEGITGTTAFAARRAGCPVAAKVVEQYIDYIAVGLQSLGRIFQPDAIILGGAISNEGDTLLLPLRERVTLPIEICISNLKNNAGVLGAAALAAQITD